MEKPDLQNSDIELLIISHLTGSISEKDLTELQEWINASIDNMNYFNKIKDSWILAGGKNSASLTDTQKSWDLLKQKLDQAGSVKRTESDFNFRYLKLAASWILIFGLGSAVSWWISRKTEVAENTSNNRVIEVSTPLGARSMIKMPDSTLIWLNAGTTITYNQDYGQQTRTVSLSGEAYFNVAKDSQHPFIVNTQGIDVRALGTRFNVKAYPEEETISATLEEGKIDIGVISKAEKNERVLLRPNDKLIYHKETRETEKAAGKTDKTVYLKENRQAKPKLVNITSDVRTELYTSWKDPRWIIFREPLSTLAPMLERRYNLKIIFDDEQIKKYKFTGIIENETVDQILGALKLTAPLNFQITKDTIRLTLDPAASQQYIRIMTNKN